MTDFPATCPPSWEQYPVEIRRYLTARLVAKQLAIHENGAGLIRSLYVGVAQADLQLAQTWSMDGWEFWPYVVADTKAWLEERKQLKASPPETPQ